MPSTQELHGRPGGTATPAAAANAPSASAAHPEADHPPRHARLVGLILGAVVACTLVMVGFIWYRWQGVNEPTTAVIVEGDATFDGTVVTVTGARTITTELTSSNDYIAPVLLEPGWYRVTAEHRGRVLVRQEVEVKRFLGVRFRLSELSGSTPGPSTPPDDSTTQ